MTQQLLKTACFDWHLAHGARIVDFAGWQMPVQYTSIVAEHQAVRRAAGLFDIAHMGRLRVAGPDAEAFLDEVVTCDVRGLEANQVRYGLVTNNSGGILDDVLVYRLETEHLLVVNASNRVKILEWLDRCRGSRRVTVDDQTLSHFMLALQGPLAQRLLQPMLAANLAEIRYYRAAETTFCGEGVLVSRTGYTGEDGFEVILPGPLGPVLWRTLVEAGQSDGLLPAGLGCRDTLRLEAAMPLYGHELDETIDPFTAGVGFAVCFEKPALASREPLLAARNSPDRPRRVGLHLAGRRIARERAGVFAGDTVVGHVTSGTFSPSLEKSIAMAYVARSHSAVGSQLAVDIRGRCEPATVVKLPFYRRASSPAAT